MRGLKRTAATLAAIGLSAGILAGCGSSSSSDSASSTPADTTAAASTAAATTPALTAAEYRTQVAAICSKLDANMNSLDNSNVNSVSQAKAAIAKSVSEAEAGIAELGAVTPPADLQAAHDALVQSSQSSVELFNSLVSTLESGTAPDTATLRADAKKAGAIYVKQRAAVKALGLKGTACFPADTGDDSDGNDDNDRNDGND